MKIIKKIIPYLLATLPQILIENYTLIVVFTIITGFFGGYILESKKVFFKILLIQFFVFSILFFISRDHIFYLDVVLENLGMTKILAPILFITFNVLNISILFFFGFKLQNLIVYKTKKS